MHGDVVLEIPRNHLVCLWMENLFNLNFQGNETIKFFSTETYNLKKFWVMKLLIIIYGYPGWLRRYKDFCFFTSWLKVMAKKDDDLHKDKP